MKKILMVILFLFCLTGCAKYKEYTELSYEELNGKLDNNESFVLVIGSSTCSACTHYKGIMDEVIKDKQVEIFYLDLHKLSEEDNGKIDSKYSIKSTPTTLFIVDGKENIYDRMIGSSSYGKVIEKLKKYGYVGE